MDEPRYYMSSVVNCWLRNIKKAGDAKKAFTETGEMCRQFFSGSVGFMWEDKFRSRFLKNVTPPRFRVTIAKAFELVAVFGPSLFWRYPGRTIKSREIFQPDPSFFGNPEDPAVAEQIQAFMQQVQQEKVTRNTRDKLMEQYLNYAQREQPGGGLKLDAQLAVTEALVKGRGVLWCQDYSFPGSDRKLTGSFFDTVDNLFIDPDATRPNLTDAHWIAKKHIDKYWEVERRFKLPPGTLRDKARGKTADMLSQQETLRKPNASSAQVGDQIVWYEVFSKCGVGTRQRGIVPDLHEAFEDVVGDFAYICVCEGVDYPLNAPPERFENAEDEQVLEMFDWPVPYYKDGRWPCAWLDFYPNPNSVWPLAPMAMGLGELIFLNTMMSVLCERSYENSRLLIAAIKGHASDAVAKIKNGSMKEVIEMNPEMQASIKDLIQVIQLPEIGFDLFKMINMVSAMFDKRTGLSELLYGMNPGGSASRTAADINVKSEMASVRPEYMSQQVEDWQSEVANVERIAAGWKVIGDDVSPLVGMFGAQLWDQLITNDDPEIFVREMRCTVEANSIRKPNKTRDNENIQRISQYLFPELSKHAEITGDTEPINNFIEDMGAAMEQDTKRWTLPSREQQPDPEQEEMAKEQARLELADKSADVSKKQAETEGQSIENEKLIQEMQLGEVGGEVNDQELQRQVAEQEMNLAAKQAEEYIKLDSMQAENELELEFQKELNDLKLDAASAS
ncbi:MAG: hypothetical protein CMK32_08085 [Porticoccaceae bacterium]|nr:hypothetical protein [Porticoccaceae bacterium]